MDHLDLLMGDTDDLYEDLFGCPLSGGYSCWRPGGFGKWLGRIFIVALDIE